MRHIATDVALSVIGVCVSVCMYACLCVCVWWAVGSRMSCEKNWWTDWCCSRALTHLDLRNHMYWWVPDHATGRSTFERGVSNAPAQCTWRINACATARNDNTAMRPVAKLLMTLVCYYIHIGIRQCPITTSINSSIEFSCCNQLH